MGYTSNADRAYILIEGKMDEKRALIFCLKQTIYGLKNKELYAQI